MAKEKPSFFDSEACRSGRHCGFCRDHEGGRSWRKQLRVAFDIPSTDFDCPHGIAWGAKLVNPTHGNSQTQKKAQAHSPSAETRGDLPSPMQKKLCGGCGKSKVRPSGAPASIWETPPIYGRTRPSCMECVTKHIGAAMVLLSETKNGYPHYLLAVGHLHEAEEESQAWPDLATAIRATRKELQTTGTVPDWDGITKMMKTLNDYSGAS
jgi:hypothetical protein